MPLWGTEADMHELMRRHEAEGMDAFKPDDTEFGLNTVTVPSSDRSSWRGQPGIA